MSEVIQKHDNRTTIRWKLLTSASAFALTTYISAANVACASDADRPSIWIELGGGFDQIAAKQELFSPPFVSMTGVSGPLLQGGVYVPHIQNPMSFGFYEEGKLSFQPDGSDWIFSAAIRYGRSSSNRNIHQQTSPIPWYLPAFGNVKALRTSAEFSDTIASKSQSNDVLDFQAGKDVGLGMFGIKGQSTISGGVRIAQFHSALKAKLGLDPNTGGDYTYTYLAPYATPHVGVPVSDPHLYLGEIQSKRSFSGIGPEISWDSSVNITGNENNGELTLDWGLNAALLFGRQRASVHHQQTERTGPSVNLILGRNHGTVAVYQRSTTPPARSRTVTVPNVGGFAGLSFRYSDAKISFGYRADFFFGAMDGGLDARRSESIGFHGPYASVSFGLGD